MDIRVTPDGIVSFVEERVLKKVKFSEFIENLKSLKPVSTGIIPYGCILYSKTLDVSSFVYEETPSIKMLNWFSASGRNSTCYPISLPFIYWFIRINGSRISSVKTRSSLTPVRELDSSLRNSCLPNFYDGGEGEMCRGSTEQSSVDISDRSFLKNIVNNFWSSNWNGDLSTPLPVGVTSYKDWAEMSLKHPMMWHNLSMREIQNGKKTIGDLIEGD